MALIILAGIVAIGGGIASFILLKDIEVAGCFIIAGILLAMLGVVILFAHGDESLERREPYKIVLSENVNYIGHDA